MPKDEHTDRMQTFLLSQLFPDEQRHDDGIPVGFTRSTLVRAIEVWFHARGSFVADEVLTVGTAATAFALPPAFIAEAIDADENDHFFARPAATPADRLLDCDGY